MFNDVLSNDEIEVNIEPDYEKGETDTKAMNLAMKIINDFNQNWKPETVEYIHSSDICEMFKVLI